MQKTEEDIRREKTVAMGAELGELHFLLWNDLVWLHFEWQQFMDLFGADATRIDIMNEAAPRFFWSLERVLWQDILLSLSRLADPPGTGGQQNLTFRRLLGAMPPDGPRAATGEAIEHFENAARFAREWRHALFAHRNLAHAADSDAHPLPHASRASVIAALEAADDLMNIVELHYQQSTNAYNSISDNIGGAYDLLLTLDRGLQAREKNEELDFMWTQRFK